MNRLLRRDRMFIAAALTALAGAALLFGLINRLLWEQSMRAEEARVERLARDMGLRAESMIVDTLAMLESFDRSSFERCGREHVDAMHRAAIGKPFIRSIGYWQAAERLCGVGFNQSIELKPARADRIYESGVVAWWPGPQTAIGGTELFLMRYGDHDVAIDPRMLLQDSPDPNRRAELWVEDLPMAATGDNAGLPSPGELAEGLTLDNGNRRILSRFSFGRVFPMDVVAVDSIQGFRDRYLPTLAAAGGLGLALSVVWIYLVFRYSRHRMSLATELKNALQKGRITAYYQPIVELETGRCVGAEALARWIREDGEVVSPDVFIPLAEQTGLMNRLSLAVIDALVRDLRSLLREFPLLRINLNLAPENLGSSEFLRRLRHRLANASISPQRVKLEITERAMINSDRSRQLVRELRERGHQIAIDDFGTGYSSLGYLQTFELDTLKIDKSFVDAIGTEAVTNHVIGHVIDMAASLKLDTVAEGIEYPQQAAWLRAHGVAYGQGFLYSEPVPAEPFGAFFRACNRTDTDTSDDAA